MRIFKTTALIIGVIGMVLLTGCVPWTGSCQVQAERKDEHTVNADQVSSFKIRTSFGNIQLTGSESPQCHVQANIQAHACSLERAQQLADATQVVLDQDHNRLDLHVDRPSLTHGESVGVSFTIECPHTMIVDGKTSYGNISIQNIQGRITAETSFGNLHVARTGLGGNPALDLQTSYGNIEGQEIDTPDLKAITSFANIDLQGRAQTYPLAQQVICQTGYGNVTCRGLSAQHFKLNTSFANATLQCGPQTPADVQIQVTSSYGNVSCDLPENYAGSVNLSTSFGDIYSARDVLTRGVHKNRLRGTVGRGNGQVECHSSFGNVHLK